MTLTLKKIADLIGGTVIGDEQIIIEGLNSLEDASKGDISFYADHRYRKHLNTTKASAILVLEKIDHFQGPQAIVSNPMMAYAKVAEFFKPREPSYSGLSDQASIHNTSRIGSNVSIYPFVYVGADAVIGDDSILYPGVFIGDRVHVGSGTVLYPNVTVMHDCVIGKEVIIHAGSVIGSDGFGFLQDGLKNIKIPQNGIVQIDDQVEIGAGNTIDRAALGKTWIQQGVKTDNLVQIAHNVVIGEGTIIVAQTAFGGSVRIGKGVIIGGQVAVSDHVEVGDRAMIGSQSGVPKSIPPGDVVSGTPAMPHRLWMKTRGLIKRLPQFKERVRNLEKKVKDLENKP